jgi:hypothetical protein
MNDPYIRLYTYLLNGARFWVVGGELMCKSRSYVEPYCAYIIHSAGTDILYRYCIVRK